MKNVKKEGAEFRLVSFLQVSSHSRRYPNPILIMNSYYRYNTRCQFIANEYGPLCNALLDPPSLQTKPHILCTCNCILQELLILPRNILHKSCDNTF